MTSVGTGFLARLISSRMIQYMGIVNYCRYL